MWGLVVDKHAEGLVLVSLLFQPSYSFFWYYISDIARAHKCVAIAYEGRLVVISLPLVCLGPRLRDIHVRYFRLVGEE